MKSFISYFLPNFYLFYTSCLLITIALILSSLIDKSQRPVDPDVLLEGATNVLPSLELSHVTFLSPPVCSKATPWPHIVHQQFQMIQVHPDGLHILV